jgi:hypothetical protein
LNATNRNTQMDFKGDELVIWGEWFEQEAKKHSITFIDASLSLQQIFDIIGQG